MASINTALRNLLADALGEDANSGILRVYDGTPPTDADEALGSQELLADITLPSDAFAAAADGAIEKSGTWDDQSIDASGEATWFRLLDSTESRILQGTVTGTGGGGDMEVDDVNFVAGGVFTVTGFTVTMPAS